MTNQELIDKYLSEFHEIQKLKVPIELNSYLHRMLDEALRIHVVSQRSELLIGLLIKLENGGGNSFIDKEQIVEDYLKAI